MSGYLLATLSLSGCIHFETSRDDDDDDLESVVDRMVAKRLRSFYIDGRVVAEQALDLCNTVAGEMKLEHAPYLEAREWFKFSDDLSRASRTHSGAIVVVDHARVLLSINERETHELIEAFLVSLGWWLKAKKPFHLFLQMVEDARIAKLFGSPQDLCN